MGTFYKLTNWLWGISDLPWPIFGAVWVGTILKVILGGIGLCLVVLVFPFVYIYGLYKWYKTKICPEWFWPFWYSFLFGWYIFMLIR